ACDPADDEGCTGSTPVCDAATAVCIARLSCDEIYQGVVPNYLSCVETETDCEFYYQSGSPRDCAELCGSAGGSCIDAWNDSAGSCARSLPVSCDNGGSSQICRCTRGS